VPILQQLGTNKIILPVSKITCEIGLSYGDVTAIEDAINSSMELKTGKDVVNTINGSVISKEKSLLLTLGIKSWDATDKDGHVLPISMESLALLELDDGNFLYEELSKQHKKKTTQEDKKK